MYEKELFFWGHRIPEGAGHRKPMLVTKKDSFAGEIKPEGAAHRKLMLL